MSWPRRFREPDAPMATRLLGLKDGKSIIISEWLDSSLTNFNLRGKLAKRVSYFEETATLFGKIFKIRVRHHSGKIVYAEARLCDRNETLNSGIIATVFLFSALSEINLGLELCVGLDSTTGVMSFCPASDKILKSRNRQLFEIDSDPRAALKSNIIPFSNNNKQPSKLGTMLSKLKKILAGTILAVGISAAAYGQDASSLTTSTNVNTGKTTVSMSNQNNKQGTNMSLRTEVDVNTGQVHIYSDLTSTLYASAPIPIDFAQQIKDIESHNANAPELPELYYKLGQKLDYNKKYSEAISAYKMAVKKILQDNEVKPTEVKILSDSCLAIARGPPVTSYEESIKYLELAIKFDDKNASLHGNLIYYLWQNNEIEKAKIQLEYVKNNNISNQGIECLAVKLSN